jgi:hypothetical protein
MVPAMLLQIYGQGRWPTVLLQIYGPARDETGNGYNDCGMKQKEIR